MSARKSKRREFRNAVLYSVKERGVLKVKAK